MADTTTSLAQFLYGRLPQIGGSGGSASGVLTVNTTSYTTAGTSEEDAWTYTLPANTLSADGRAIRITAWGNSAANANSKTATLYFGGTSLRAQSSTASGASWMFQWTIIRTGASAEIAAGLTSFAGSGVNPNHTVLAIDTTAAIVIKITLTTATAAADASFKAALVELLN